MNVHSIWKRNTECMKIRENIQKVRNTRSQMNDCTEDRVIETEEQHTLDVSMNT